jgi:rifampicin phosphotransferase
LIFFTNKSDRYSLLSETCGLALNGIDLKVRDGQQEQSKMEATMSTFVLTLSDSHAVLENVGGKGMSLAKLARAGLAVPAGFHITTEAYWRFVTDNGLQPRILAALQGLDVSNSRSLEAAALLIGAFFAQGQVSPEITRAISDAYIELSNHQFEFVKQRFVAVRSSATAEDLPGASFAGQQETFLNIRGVPAVLDAVRKCWASLWTARAIAYRARQAIDPDQVALAVVVQEMVFADAAGVLFTANPVNGRREEVMITATWGLGEAIVSGSVTPDMITASRLTGRLIRRATAEKQVMTIRTKTGTCDAPVPGPKKKKAVLTNSQVVLLARLGVEIERLYEMPMDIEWTLAKRKFAIVQARPITALPDPPLEWPLPGPKTILARGSFAEFLPDPVSPLFGTLAIPISRRASVRLMRDVLGVNDPDAYIMSVLNGYVYVGMKLTPKMIWLMLLGSTINAKKLISGSMKRWSVIRVEFSELVGKWQARDLAGLRAVNLIDGVRAIFGLTAEYYTVVQSGVIPTSMLSETVFGKFYHLLVERKGEPAAATFLFGAENQAVRAEKALFDLAMWAKNTPELADYLTRTPVEDICSALQANPQPASVTGEFAARFDAYLREYGHAIYDLDFAKPVPAETPATLVETIRVYLGGRNNPYERQRMAQERSTRIAAGIVKRLDPLCRKWFQKLLKWAQETAPLREDGIAELGLGHPQIRRLLAELGRRLAAGAAIASGQDVYWLEDQELDTLAELLDKGEPLPHLGDEVKLRKANWQAMRRLTPPNTLPENSIMARFYPSEGQAGDTLKGFGASAGKITAPACLLLGPEDFDNMRQGDVIVTGITTPAWTPLFARAAAIVTDIGGPLSHSSIVAREYCIPAVLGTSSGTRRIRNGQMITVDGNAGTVTLLETGSIGDSATEGSHPDPGVTQDSSLD